MISFNYNIDDFVYVVSKTYSSYCSITEHSTQVIQTLKDFENSRIKTGKIRSKISSEVMPFYLYDFMTLKVMKKIEKNISSFVEITQKPCFYDGKTSMSLKLVNSLTNKNSNVYIYINSRDSYNWTIEDISGYPKELYSIEDILILLTRISSKI
jgi:hypothetical protein